MAVDPVLALSSEEPLLDVEQAAALLNVRPSWVRDTTKVVRPSAETSQRRHRHDGARASTVVVLLRIDWSVCEPLRPGTDCLLSRRLPRPAVLATPAITRDPTARRLWVRIQPVRPLIDRSVRWSGGARQPSRGSSPCR